MRNRSQSGIGDGEIVENVALKAVSHVHVVTEAAKLEYVCTRGRA